MHCPVQKGADPLDNVYVNYACLGGVKWKKNNILVVLD